MILQQILNGIMLGGTYALLALGYTLIFGILRLLHIAHGEVFMVGAYAGYFLSSAYGVSYPVAILGAMAGAVVTGILIELVGFRPLRNAPQLAPLIASLGLSIFIQNLALLVWSPTPRMFHTPYLDRVVHLGVISMSAQRVVVFVVSVVLIAALYLVVQRTALGKAMRATALDAEAASLMGINVRSVVVATFALGSALAGVAGALVGPILILSPFMGIPVILKAFAVVIMGGFGNIQGTIAAGFMLGIVEGLGAMVLPSIYIDIIAFVMLIGTLLVRPTGLFAEPLEENV